MTDKKRSFFKAIDDLFDVKRGVSNRFGVAQKVPAKHLQSIMFEITPPYWDGKGEPPQPEPVDYVSSVMTTGPMKGYIEKYPEQCDHVLVENILGYLLQNSRRKYTENKKKHPFFRSFNEKRNTFPYSGRVWEVLGAIADVRPELFKGEKVQKQLHQYFTNEKYLRHAECVKTISALYFKHGVLSPYDYAFLSLHALDCDSGAKSVGIYSGPFIDYLSESFGVSDRTNISGFYDIGLSIENRRHNAQGNAEYNRQLSYLFPEIEKQQDRLVEEFPIEAVELLRALAIRKDVKDQRFPMECSSLLIKVLRRRPDFAKESDLSLFCTEVKDMMSPEPMIKELETLKALSNKYPDWNWNKASKYCDDLEGRLQCVEPYYVSFSMSMTQMTVSRTRCDNKNALYLNGWDPEDNQTINTLKILSLEVSEQTKEEPSRGVSPINASVSNHGLK